MQSSPDYDPEADLAALRADGNTRVAVWALFAVAVFVFGSYLQSLIVDWRMPYLLWVHGKLLLLAALVVTALRTSKLRPVVRIAYPAIALIALAESVGWVAFLIVALSATMSCFAYAAVAASAVALLFTPLVFRSLRNAEAARERLALNGIDDPFA